MTQGRHMTCLSPRSQGFKLRSDDVPVSPVAHEHCENKSVSVLFTLAPNTGPGLESRLKLMLIKWLVISVVKACFDSNTPLCFLVKM